MTVMPGCSLRAFSTCSTLKRRWTEQWPFQRMTRGRSAGRVWVLPLVVGAEDAAGRAELAARLGDAGDDAGGVETPVLLRDVLLPEGEGALLGERSRLQGALSRALHRLVAEGLPGHE